MECRHRLYLSKGNQLVYIDNCNVSQHHIDGIRFLYRLFKKNKPGSIVNDPAECDRNIQIVLFLKAVCHLLDKTILLLCPEGSEHDWLELFRTWTDLADDVVIETVKPYRKKKVIINGMVNLPLFSQQDWSIVVVNDDEPPNGVLRYSFKAGFKIWNTSVNMKKNLGAFSSIYTWLNEDRVKSKTAKEIFNVKDFTPVINNVKDVIHKAVLLDAFMEDVVIRRTNIDCNLEESIHFLAPNIVSKKNKDSTGTKVKRSKRKVQDAVTKPLKDMENNESTVSKLPRPSYSGKEDTIEPTCVLKPVSSDNLQIQVEEINKNTCSSQNSDIKLVFETDTMTESDKIYEMDTLFDNTKPVKDIHINESTVFKLPKPSDAAKEDNINLTCELKPASSDNLHEQVEEINKNTVNSQDSEVKLVFEADTMTENDKIYEMDTLVDATCIEDANNEIVHNEKHMECHDCVIEDPKSNELNKMLNVNSEKWRITDIIIKSESQELKEPDVVMTDVQVKGETDTTDATNLTDELAIKITESPVFDRDKPIADDIISENVITGVNNEILKHDQASSYVTKVDDNEIKETSVNPVLDDIDFKSNKFKEQAMKRFKGSVLDSIF